MYRIGVDVGGTNTDAAILDITQTSSPLRGLLASAKTPTSPNISEGIKCSVEQVLTASGVDRQGVLSVAIGTTHFINAVVQAQGHQLARVAVIRLCGPFTRQVPPFVDFPARLKQIVEGPVFYLDGGIEIDGREILPLNEDEIKATVRKLRKVCIDKVALVGVFSAIDKDGINERRCKEIMLTENPQLDIVCSADIGGPGLLERENATILNAAILDLARDAFNAFSVAIGELGLACDLFLTQNDGTLTDVGTANQFPIQTFSSGPINSMTGAAFLASVELKGVHHEKQVLVVDVGGTTTDVCALLPSGFPRPAPSFVEIGGVRTAFSMPEVLSIGLGGGSCVEHDSSASSVTVGPTSVGNLLRQKALVFGGETLTATDIVVAAGKAKLGNAINVSRVPQAVISQARAEIKKRLQAAVQRMKTSSLPVTLLLVGGGSLIYMDQLDGVDECIIPPHHDSANAVGAAVAKISGIVDTIEILEGNDAAKVLRDTENKAIEVALKRGAAKEDIKIVELEQIPLQYMTTKAARIIVKAVGKVAIGKAHSSHKKSKDFQKEAGKHKKTLSSKSSITPAPPPKTPASVDILIYEPSVRGGVWSLTATDLELISIGTGILGAGGGGPSYLQYLDCLSKLDSEHPGKMRVISPKAISDSDVCVLGVWYGAPSVSGERIPNGSEIRNAVEWSVRASGCAKFDAIIAAEIGGGNGMSAFPTGVFYDIPVLDGDHMGRAFPTIGHILPYIYGAPITPCAISDCRDNAALITSTESNGKVEKLLRSMAVELGLMTGVSPTPLPGTLVKRYCVPNTISQAWYLGRAVRRAQQLKVDVVESILDVNPGKLLYTGKIVHVQRDISGGYTMGTVTIAPLSPEEQDLSHTSPCPWQPQEQRHLVVPFQNEYLYATFVDSGCEDVICSIPDLISIIGQDGQAIGSPELRYGLTAHVIAMAAHPLWTSEKALKVGGPAGFGLDFQWTSIGTYKEPRSVIEEFDGKNPS
ncbi:uncharacterized protein BDW43DRAFT_322600 [Aspergillus alliaceus]|uniref:uncharacterized protein n=1 Tax=Petromyces alliaceus TaxID=209559 RepID=UPI0012A3B49B|nr:uncharacterized protein BDW43DRAFT_322600 [Aspergillus alliaceus]KAB8237171.1 hypothetical protein BDW43DRAFT_322600 [Aspergillus alliaceus]